jgi:uncharacterized membrane protein
MTEEKTTPDATTDDVVVAAVAVGDEHGVVAEGAIVTDGSSAIIVARFADTDAAITAYDLLRDAESQGRFAVDGVLVVKADESGRLQVQKLTDHSTRTGLKWGIVGGVVAGIFLPATIVAGAVVLGFAGAAAGKARNLARRLEIEKDLKDVITPGTSGIMALVSALAVEDVAKALPEAQEVKTVPVDAETADAIRAVAAESESTPAEEAAPDKA